MMPAHLLRTALCERLAIDLPIVQAPIGSASSPALVAAVSNAGGLGMLSVTWRSIEAIHQALGEIRELTTRPFGVNIALAWPVEEKLAMCLEAGVPIISFFWGDPSPYVDAVHASSALLMQTIGRAQEARQAVAAGVDVVIAQGWEAGGHVWGEVASLPLIPCVVDAVSPTPVVAAGGIGDGRGLAAALMLGASGVWMGTRFLLAEEAAVHPSYQEHIRAAAETDARYTHLFDGGWPNAPHRALRNSTMAQWEAAGFPASGQRPGEGDVIAWFADGRSAERYSDILALPGMTGDVDALALDAGQSAGLATHIQPAAEIVREIADGAIHALHYGASLIRAN
jgi:NAD(P)H-dependent flavin oxidoreductase YrpB (nitropropane dioxygenase family)